MIVVVGLSHKTAPIAVRERLAVQRDALPALYERLLADRSIGEAVVLSTCNRVEVYAAPPRGGSLEATSRATIGALAAIGGDVVTMHLGRKEGGDAVRHLFRVASSLDSLVVGEPQILGQLKDAIELARESKALGQTLGKAMLRAVRVGKRARSETAIGEGQVSVSSVAVDLAQEIFGDLTGRKAALVGAGEMAEAAAKLLAKAGAKIIVLNRSPARAKVLAYEVSGEPRGMQELERTLGEVDIAIGSTSSPTPVITVDLVKRVRKVRRGKSLFLIDIAVPRDVEPAVNDLDGVYLYDVDDLSQIVAQSLEGRAAEAARAEAIVEEEARAFEHWTLERELTPTIVGLFNRTRAVLLAELERSFAGRLKHLGAAEKEALLVMVDAATNKLLHAPVTRLKELAGDARAEGYVEAVRDLFDLSAIALEAITLKGGDGSAIDGAITLPTTGTNGKAQSPSSSIPRAPVQASSAGSPAAATLASTSSSASPREVAGAKDLG
ncbi:glutamyl-tRNA reductase [Polyangium mundeleinium]|uniref:Glutamyl-tRNA reductase n=1 Tax=Polyangium mundeleinium TaxID=2995306 RepID=A0ABT5EKU9_9BACT|nr:glutamyl-tRNA reductase [Polyangium mundeleinium]MDC0742453.1 glutamyl-tRNA reductase [Polyangium mundeleinium]